MPWEFLCMVEFIPLNIFSICLCIVLWHHMNILLALVCVCVCVCPICMSLLCVANSPSEVLALQAESQSPFTCVRVSINVFQSTPPSRGHSVSHFYCNATQSFMPLSSIRVNYIVLAHTCLAPPEVLDICGHSQLGSMLAVLASLPGPRPQCTRYEHLVPTL